MVLTVTLDQLKSELVYLLCRSILQRKYWPLACQIQCRALKEKILGKYRFGRLVTEILAWQITLCQAAACRQGHSLADIYER